MKDQPSKIREISSAEVSRDLVNWLDGTQPDWRCLSPEQKLGLLNEARAYLADVSRRYRIPDAEFLPPLEDAAERVRLENGF